MFCTARPWNLQSSHTVYFPPPHARACVRTRHKSHSRHARTAGQAVDFALCSGEGLGGATNIHQPVVGALPASGSSPPSSRSTMVTVPKCLHGRKKGWHRVFHPLRKMKTAGDNPPSGRHVQASPGQVLGERKP